MPRGMPGQGCADAGDDPGQNDSAGEECLADVSRESGSGMTAARECISSKYLR